MKATSKFLEYHLLTIVLFYLKLKFDILYLWIVSSIR